jgi:hypothetical protein
MIPTISWLTSSTTDPKKGGKLREKKYLMDNLSTYCNLPKLWGTATT